MGDHPVVAEPLEERPCLREVGQGSGTISLPHHGTGGAARLRRQHREGGLRIGAETPVAGWGGERCDWRYVAEVHADAAHDARTRAGP